MSEYKVGSLGNLISGKGEVTVGPKIVYEKVSPRSHVAQIYNSSPSIDEVLSAKLKATSTLREKGKKLKDKVAGSLLRKRRAEIAGDDDSETFGKSWKHLPSREKESEVDGVQPQPESFSQNAARRIHIKKNSKKHVDDPEREARTLFVGNIPYEHAKKKKLIKFFSKYGDVETVRFRCAPLKDPRMSKKVAVIKHEFHPERSSICAYVVFKSEDQAKHALEANGSVYHEHHLRVDMAGNASNKQIDPRKCVFIGNLSFAAEEEDLWELFSKCGTISSVRIVRDPITAVSKGIAFVNFETADAAELALELDGNTLRKRNISVRRHKPSAKPSSEKSTSEMLVRHKENEKLDNNNREKEDAAERIKMAKKEKRRMRREGEKLLGIVKERKMKNDARNGASESKIKTQTVDFKQLSKLKFQGQTVESANKKKKKVNKGDLKKKKVAHLLGSGTQKIKKKA